MKIKALAPWFGGKRTMAPEIVAELGKHTQYFEPFCGSMAVLFAKDRSQKETANDLHGDLINLARVIQIEAGAIELFGRAHRTLFADQVLKDAQSHVEPPLEVDLDPRSPEAIDRAFWYLLVSWMGRNGTAGTSRLDYQLAVRWTNSGGSPTVRWSHAIDSIPWWYQRLQNVAIIRRDAFDIIPRFEDAKGTAMYVDSPYCASTRSVCKSKGSSRYLYEFEHDSPMFGNDHVRLRDTLAKFKHARIVVSYYDCLEIRELYAGWTFVEKHRQKHLHAVGGRGARPKSAPEVLIINGRSLHE